MKYAFKPTTNGRAVIAACGGLSKPFRITRAAVGSGLAPEGVNLADVHELYQYVTEAAISEYRHEGDRLFLTVQYANGEHKDTPDFILSEFMVYVEDPESGRETDLLYATLGDFGQPVPAYTEGIPESVFSYPMVLTVSDEIEVQVFASPGIVTPDVLENALLAIKAELEETTRIEAEEPPTPETEGQPGQHYFDRKTGREYVCKGKTEEGGYIWEEAATTPIVEEKISKHNEDPEAHPDITARTRGLELALNGSETLTGEGAPTSETEGKKDQHYIDVATGEDYICTGVEDGAYTWEPAKEAPSFMEKLAEDFKISGETKAVLGLGPDATVDDVLLKLSGYDDPKLTFSSTDDFSLESGAKHDGVLYISQDGFAWTPWDGRETKSKNGKLYLRGEGNTFCGSHGDYSNDVENYHFRFPVAPSGIECTGNILSLLDYRLVRGGIEPAMAQYGFTALFYGCKMLTTAPELPSTRLTPYCYYAMFDRCTSLVSAPELPATTLASTCYDSMFYLCTSLVSAPELPATTLAPTCYNSMFGGCTSLKTLPKLPATRLAEYCYASMIKGCTSIKLSTEISEEYPNQYRIPVDSGGTTATDAMKDMFANTGGTFKGTPTINKVYYTPNEIV